MGAGQRGLEALRRSDLPNAERLLRSAHLQEPRNTLWQKWLGVALASQEKYREAEPLFADLCHKAPKDDDACYYLGRTLFTLGRLAEAQSAFELALKTGAKTGRTWHGLALVFDKSGQGIRAEDAYRKALQLGQHDATSDFGLWLASAGRFEEALELLEGRPEAGHIQRMAKLATPMVRAGARLSWKIVEFGRPVRNGAAGRKRLPETMAGGLAILDVDRDGLPDVFIPNGGGLPDGPKEPDALYRNAGDGRMVEVTNSGLAGFGYNIGAAAADFDRDGYQDLFVTGLRASRLYRNRADGHFEDVTERAGLPAGGDWAVSAVWLDYDRDGDLDLFVIRYVVWDPVTEPVCEDRQLRTWCHPSHYDPLPNSLYRNDGKGRFEDVSAASGISAHKGKGMGAASGDFDGDGWPDVFVANDSVPNFLFRNRQDGTFQEHALEAGVALKDDGRAVSSMGAAFADFNNDGLDELTVSALSDETFLWFRGMAKGRFEDARLPSRVALLSQPYTGWGIAIADLDNDGLRDFIVAGGHVQDNAERVSSRSSKQPILVFRNRGGSFDLEQLGAASFYRGLAVADLNRDGRLDIIASRLNDRPVAFLNQTTGGNWIGFEPGLWGTQVRIEAMGALQWSRLTPNYGYGSSHQPVVHFGIGSAANVRSALIRWPDGTQQQMLNPELNRLHVLKQP